MDHWLLYPLVATARHRPGGRLSATGVNEPKYRAERFLVDTVLTGYCIFLCLYCEWGIISVPSGNVPVTAEGPMPPLEDFRKFVSMLIWRDFLARIS